MFKRGIIRLFLLLTSQWVCIKGQKREMTIKRSQLSNSPSHTMAKRRVKGPLHVLLIYLFRQTVGACSLQV